MTNVNREEVEFNLDGLGDLNFEIIDTASTSGLEQLGASCCSCSSACSSCCVQME